MHVLREAHMISGFLYEAPVVAFPALTHCGEALCCRSHALPLHQHPGFEFHYLSRGLYHWRVGQKKYSQKMGSLFIVHPGEAHSTGLPPDAESHHLWFGLKLERAGDEGLLLARKIRRDHVRLLTDFQEMEPLLHVLIRQVIEPRPLQPEATASLLHGIIWLVLQRLAGGESSSPAPTLPYSVSVRKALVYMQKNLERRLPLEELSAIAGMRQTSHFCSRFHREVGVTPANYHARLRLEQAREALRQPGLDITSVALQFGFSSSQHFSTLFRRAYGMTPRQMQLGKQ